MQQRYDATMTRLIEVILKKDFEFSELLSGLVLIGWSIVLLMPWNTFESAHSFDAMAALLPESMWGLLLGWVGVTQVGALALSQYRVRLVSSLIACCTWVFIGIVIGWSNPQGLWIAIYPQLAASAAWSFWRLAREGP